MSADTDPFSLRYASARAKFLQAAQDAGLAVTSYPLDLPGRDGESLAVDVAWQGPRDARHLLMLSSGVHGVEGYCGSGAQIALLRDAAWMARTGAGANAGSTAVLYVHALNPYGFSHLRRVTQENVDLNRNFQDFSQALPANPAYCKLHPQLLPQAWPPTWRNRAAIFGLIATQGLRRLQTAISGGQYERADGLFFGGTEPTWSHLTLRRLLREHAQGARKLAWIDLHTGLGRNGHCERAFMGTRENAAAYARANAWWGSKAPLTHLGAANSVSAGLAGLIWSAALQECPHTEFTGMYMEFGTQPLLKVMHALRGDHWLYQHPQPPPTLAEAIKQRLFEAFFTDTPAWKQAVMCEARAAALQALDALRGSAATGETMANSEPGARARR
jgi:hypothetical protein